MQNLTVFTVQVQMPDAFSDEDANAVLKSPQMASLRAQLHAICQGWQEQFGRVLQVTCVEDGDD